MDKNIEELTLLFMYLSWEAKGLVKKTIRRYLNYYDITKMEDGIISVFHF